MYINRLLESRLRKFLKGGKILVLYGPRQVGKTTLIKHLASSFKTSRLKLVSGDEIIYRHTLASQSKEELAKLVGNLDILIIDEAQRIENVGLNLKILADNFPKLMVLVTGSASLDLAGKISEPLTGRKQTLFLYPVSFEEISKTFGRLEAESRLSDLLIWGSYPKVFQLDTKEEKESYLSEVVGSYLFKDILELEGIKKAGKIVDLLRLLAFQIGTEVAISELASNLSLDHRTVTRYLELLEQSFVIYQVRGFSRNLRKEIAKTSRYYFLDNGVRNALIENFNALNLRNDIGQLWENFIYIERKKYLHHRGTRANIYFWRTYDQKEIDLIEEKEGKLSGFEIKWKGKIKKTSREEFIRSYPNSRVDIINKDNYEGYIL
ncbi:MAG: hypothetical protein UT40_C0032G0009 [Candidatus Woesebacteria bacterium GW2011_GWA1_39_21b]|uniref:AAA+ ATPase domain-containing protein n=2 Tax=Candidatus Woeseibacteriota TaxID=1752722 RepID=A0A0G0N8G1_9BACT|nr:MAG: hypothetical protein UT40_C0032G0009 [Candidatus Woesebacteria bacterium GW2011_GWA1_39_21b]OGM61381.1 MAG: hypothetical protein A3A52_02265 [Candidatus Woesebacteria bacterium RIFCSPLOWO2_01_FULL_39_14]